MICPYCNVEMRKGVIYGDRYKLKWISDEKDQGAILTPFVKGIDLEEQRGKGIITYYCPNDEIFLIEKVKKDRNNDE